MSNPIPRRVRLVIHRPIKGKGDWIRRTRRARDLLIERHGFKADTFYTVDDDYYPTLNMSGHYPRQWGRIRKHGRLRSWGWVNHIPCGLIVFNPGCDYWGEAGDDVDPILMLEDLEFWASRTEAEIADFLAPDDEDEGEA